MMTRYNQMARSSSRHGVVFKEKRNTFKYEHGIDRSEAGQFRKKDPSENASSWIRPPTSEHAYIGSHIGEMSKIYIVSCVCCCRKFYVDYFRESESVKV